jgi:methanethiol S-methyltransferase
MSFDRSRATPRTLLALGYAALAYALFLLASVCLVTFLGDVPGWRGVNDGTVLPVGRALAIDALLLLAFGVPHSVMARPGFKRWWTRFVPPVVERSTYVLVASLALLLVATAWRPIAGVVWSVDRDDARLLVRLVFWLGALLVVGSTFAISHTELFGLERPWARLRGTTPAAAFRTPLLYRLVRHPMQLGFLVTFWATPLMTLGHLALAVGMSLYIAIGLHFEERDLVRQFGEAYVAYRRRVPAVVPRHALWVGALALLLLAARSAVAG